MNDKTTIHIWTGINKNGDLRMFTDEPKRNNETGKWESKHPYVNSVLYNELFDLMQKSKITWESEPQQFSLGV